MPMKAKVLAIRTCTPCIPSNMCQHSHKVSRYLLHFHVYAEIAKYFTTAMIYILIKLNAS